MRQLNSKLLFLVNNLELATYDKILHIFSRSYSLFILILWDMEIKFVLRLLC